MQVPELIELLRQKGLVLQINYNRPVWTLEARCYSDHSFVWRVKEPDFPEAVQALLQELHLLS